MNADLHKAREQAKNLEHFRPLKEPVSIRIDKDVLFWLRQSPNYQTRINAILRDAMNADLAKSI
jgi:uncharacterized protein (DUF4415 family)